MQTQHPAVKNVVRCILRHHDKVIDDLNRKIGSKLTITQAEEILKNTSPEKIQSFQELINHSDAIEDMIRRSLISNLPVVVGTSFSYWVGEFVVDAIRYHLSDEVLVACFYLHEL